MNDILDGMVAIARMPIDRQPRYAVGQVVRVKKSVVEDGQTPLHWCGAKATVERVVVAGIFCKEWVYILRHSLVDQTCKFRECELDLRFKSAAQGAEGERP